MTFPPKNYRRYIDTNLRGSPDEACFWVFFFRMYWSIGSSSRSTAFRWASRSSSSTDRAIGLSISCKSLAILAFWLSNCFNLKIISTFSYYLKGRRLLIFDILHHQNSEFWSISTSVLTSHSNFFWKFKTSIIIYTTWFISSYIVVVFIWICLDFCHCIVVWNKLSTHIRLQSMYFRICKRIWFKCQPNL